MCWLRRNTGEVISCLLIVLAVCLRFAGVSICLCWRICWRILFLWVTGCLKTCGIQVEQEHLPHMSLNPSSLNHLVQGGNCNDASGFPLHVGGPAHNTAMLVPRVVNLRLKGKPGCWRTQQEIHLDSILIMNVLTSRYIQNIS